MALTPHSGGERLRNLPENGSPRTLESGSNLALARFREAREALARQVKRGELTPRVARRQAEELLQRLRGEMSVPPGAATPARAMRTRLAEAASARRLASQIQSPEALQRETNRLLRRTLIEQQLVNRAAEFAGRAFVRPLQGGAAAPTLESLLRFHESSAQAGDEAACEWARRQLEAMRPRITSDADLHRVDSACDRPENVNPRIVARYAGALAEATAEDMEQFVAEAIRTSDASACCAAFILARDCAAGESARWVRNLLDGLGSFPDTALNTLLAWDAEAVRQEVEAARSEADFVLSLAEAEVRSLDGAAPSADEVRRNTLADTLQPSAMDRPIGLKLVRRGLTPEEYEASTRDISEPTEH